MERDGSFYFKLWAWQAKKRTNSQIYSLIRRWFDPDLHNLTRFPFRGTKKWFNKIRKSLGRKHKHFWLSGLHPIGEIEPFVSRVCVSLTLIWVLLTQVSNKTGKGFDGLRSLVIINFQNYEGIEKKVETIFMNGRCVIMITAAAKQPKGQARKTVRNSHLFSSFFFFRLLSSFTPEQRWISRKQIWQVLSNRPHETTPKIHTYRPCGCPVPNIFSHYGIKEKEEECAKTTTAGISFSAWEIITLLLLPCHV